MKLLPILIFLVPGIIAFALTIQNPEVFNVDVNGVQKADRAFPMLVTTLLPVGLKGLVAGGLMAALMSSLASVFNSCSTIFTIDIYKKISPNKSEKFLVNVGKVATVVIVGLGILLDSNYGKNWWWSYVSVFTKCSSLYSTTSYNSVFTRYNLEKSQCSGFNCNTICWIIFINPQTRFRNLLST